MLRVISGKYRHRLLIQPNSREIRPTMDRVREGIFSSIRFELENKIVLDLFAGSGAYGIEAVSNGAMKAILVDNDRKALQAINENIETLQINNVEVNNSEAISWLKRTSGKVFDFIFLDPFYKNYDLVEECLNIIKENKCLSKYGKIIVETDNPAFINVPEDFQISKERKYGHVYVLYITHII